MATKHLAMSETAIGKPAVAPGDSWAVHYSPGRWAHESGMILSRLGDLDTAEEHPHLALDIHGLDRRRTRVIVLADLGGVRLRQGDVDGAMATWRDFLDWADGIRSMKVKAALHDMRVRYGATSRFQRRRSSASRQRASRADLPELNLFARDIASLDPGASRAGLGCPCPALTSQRHSWRR
ncbi:hypothetical protein ABZX98_32875 [Streptomyces sp. NPDC002992]|uniref:hypothetical protein n=1 Tax=Streptomyces sp. NPDC002992 TaxID=3154273 RepID=UPI0033B14B36